MSFFVGDKVVIKQGLDPYNKTYPMDGASRGIAITKYMASLGGKKAEVVAIYGDEHWATGAYQLRLLHNEGEDKENDVSDYAWTDSMLDIIIPEYTLPSVYCLFDYKN